MQMWCVAGISVSGSLSLHCISRELLQGLNSHVTVLNYYLLMRKTWRKECMDKDQFIGVGR